jgi:hypothetical protein
MIADAGFVSLQLETIPRHPVRSLSSMRDIKMNNQRGLLDQQEAAMADQVQWQLSGDYFENCNCSVVCPCLVSKAAPLTSRPTEGLVRGGLHRRTS